MKIIKFFIIFFSTLLFEKAGAEEPFIYMRINFNVIRNSDNTVNLSATEDNCRKIVSRMNELEVPFLRGYRFIVTGFSIIGGQGISGDNPSRWYNTNFFNDTKIGNKTQGRIWKDEMENAARTGSGAANYRWRNDAINVYIVNGICGGICSFPDQSDYENIIAFGACNLASTNTYAPTLLHEIGHYFNLCHTHGCTNLGVCNNTTGNNDEISDTPLDNPCWSLATIIEKNGGNISEDFARNSFDNIMSYHDNGGENRLTEQQLDRWADALDERKTNVPSSRVYNRTSIRNAYGWFVKPNAAAPQPTPNQINYFPEYGNSYKEIRLNDALIFDKRKGSYGIIFMRPGTYRTGGIIINQPITLRATRSGLVTITK
jgi:Pregnancy-associated plasma protein-A